MSKDKELTEKDFAAAELRYKEYPPEVVRLKEVKKATAEYVRFLESPAGHAAMRMLVAAKKHIEFAQSEAFTSEGQRAYSHQLNGQGGGYMEVAPNGLTRESCFRRSDVVAAWLTWQKGKEPKDFMPWFLGELKKIHDEAPKDPQGDGLSEDDASDGTAGCEREG